MLKMFEASDEYDFAPSRSSKLSSLFDGPTLINDASSSLVYTAPKQPRPKSDVDLNESSKSKSQTAVILAKVVTLWKLEDKDYRSLGRHGLAIIGSADLDLYEVISYKEKNNIILRRKLNGSWNFYNQKDCFSSFYDGENQNWLVKFDNTDDQNAFCSEIKNRRANIINNVDSVTSSEKSTVTTKETTLKPSIPPREPVIKPEILSQSLETDGEDANSENFGSQKRANILTRMAKMGQQILPSDILRSTSTDISDSELDDSRNDKKTLPRRTKRAVLLEKHVSKDENVPQVVQNQPIPIQSNFNQPVQFPQQNMVAFPQNMVSPLQPNVLNPVLYNQQMVNDGFSQYIISQNAELKMNLAQISAKLDGVLTLGSKNEGRTDDGSLKSKIKTLELRSENLLTELERYEKKYDDLQRKCKDLEGRTSENESCKSVIEVLNKKIGVLEQDLKKAEEETCNYETLQTDLEKSRNVIQDYEKTIEIQKLKLKDFEDFYEENKDNKNLQETIDTLNNTISNLKLKLKDFEEYLLKMEEEKRKRMEENEQNINIFNDKIKEHMNNMYQSVLGSFEENGAYSLPQIKSQVAQNLKSTTFAIIKEFKDIYKSETVFKQEF